MATVGILIARVLEIPHMSRKGSEHLSVDMGYLFNVISALDLTPHPLLTHLGRVVRLGREDALARLEDPAAGNDRVLAVVLKIEKQLASARGLLPSTS
ncbi:unnamed protein product [Discosporangium mesarthrocarpum]